MFKDTKSVSVLLGLAFVLSASLPFYVILELKDSLIKEFQNDHELIDRLIANELTFLLVCIVFLLAFAGFGIYIFSKLQINNIKEESFEDTISSAIDLRKDDVSSTSGADFAKALKVKLKNVFETEFIDINDFGKKFFAEIADNLSLGLGVIYKAAGENENRHLVVVASYAFHQKEADVKISFGEGLTGQVAKSKKMITVHDVPEDYVKIFSGLGEAKPATLIIIPLLKDDEVIGVVEMGMFEKINPKVEEVLKNGQHQLSEYISTNFSL